MYIYESHLGGFYSSEFQLDYDRLYCDSCGDSDILVGEFDSNSKEDAIRFIKSIADLYYGESLIDYVKDMFNVHITKNEIRSIEREAMIEWMENEEENE